jgi:simple sugar transport system permease protein
VGIRPRTVVVFAMSVGGGCAALAGATQVLAVHGSYLEGFSPGYGFTGIAVALLAGARPAGVVLAALFFAVLRSGAFAMDALAGIPREGVALVEAAIIVLVAARRFRRPA